MAAPELAAVSDDAMGLTQRELLVEMREDIKGLKGHGRRDRQGTRRQWQSRADGALVLARWALGASARQPAPRSSSTSRRRPATR